MVWRAKRCELDVKLGKIKEGRIRKTSREQTFNKTALMQARLRNPALPFLLSYVCLHYIGLCDSCYRNNVDFIVPWS